MYIPEKKNCLISREPIAYNGQKGREEEEMAKAEKTNVMRLLDSKKIPYTFHY